MVGLLYSYACSRLNLFWVLSCLDNPLKTINVMHAMNKDLLLWLCFLASSSAVVSNFMITANIGVGRAVDG